jgi:hypothetical protein
MTTRDDFDNVSVDRMEYAAMKAELREATELAKIRLNEMIDTSRRLKLEVDEHDRYVARVTRAFTTIYVVLASIRKNRHWTHNQRNNMDDLLASIVEEWLPTDNTPYVENVNDIPF